VLFAVIVLAWLAAVLIALTMFRLAALSDRFQARALADWLRSQRSRAGGASAEQATERGDAERRRRGFRAAG